MITQAQIGAAAALIGPHIRRTPTVTVDGDTFGLAGRLHLKLEYLQRSGSFKARGAFHSMLVQQRMPPAGVIAASGGNHGLAVADAAHALGVPAEIFLPRSTSKVKVDRLAPYGAKVTVTGEHYADALEASQRRGAETGALMIHAYDQLPVVTGQGTVGRELAQDAGDLDTVLVAVGGGGLIAGIASWFGGGVRVIGVEPLGIPTLTRALKAGAPVDIEVSGVAADSLGARRIGGIGLAVALRTGVESLLVSDDDIIAARRVLWSQMRIAVEYGGAAAFAALLSGAYAPRPGERVGVVLCGANTDPADLAS